MSGHTQDLEDSRPQFVGKTSAQIMMKNPIFHGIKKFLLQDKAVRKYVCSIKELDHIVEKIDSLKILAAPSKKRARGMMQALEHYSD